MGIWEVLLSRSAASIPPHFFSEDVHLYLKMAEWEPNQIGKAQALVEITKCWVDWKALLNKIGSHSAG